MFTSSFQLGVPAPALRGAVLGYTGYHERSSAPVTRRQVAEPDVNVIISFGPRIDVDGASLTSFVAGVHPGPALTTFAGEQHGVQVVLTAPAAHRLLGGLELEAISLPVVPLDALLDGADALVERLGEAPSWDARFALLDTALARRIDAGPPVPTEVGWAMGALGRGRGPGEVARELGWSDRRLLRAFRRWVGPPPTVYARLVRFRRALALLGSAQPLADVALACGYYDQAHLNRDFKAFAGVTPGAYVGSVQDAA